MTAPTSAPGAPDVSPEHPDPPTGRRALRRSTAAILSLFLLAALAGIARFLLLPP